ncbi:MAG: ribosome biogenesis GTPase YlqF [Clostridia bacterium]|nr:ribosome biogenesis GTPase YlqF [Clostridia bacterium]
MTKAMRMMEDNVKLCDGIIMILDARAPFSCINEKLNKLFEHRPVLYVLNKSDLVERKDISFAINRLKEEGKKAVSIIGTDKKAVNGLYNEIFSMLSEKLERNKAKGIFKPLRIMVAGIPNTGKSTIINTLSGAKKAVTGDKAGVTKGKQWVKLYDLELLDTPGTMPPSFADQNKARHLAYIGSINDDILDMEDLTLSLVEELTSSYPTLMKEKYGIDENDITPLEKYEKICKKRGFLLRGGEYDYSRCAKAVIDDFRKGKIGKIFLDK